MTEDFEVGGPLPEESTNRTFVIAAVALGALLILSLVCLGVYALVIAPAQQNAANARNTEIALENTRTAAQLTETVLPVQFSPTAPPTNTQAPTRTPVVVLPSVTPTKAVVVATNTSAPVTPTVRPATLQPAALTATAAQATLQAAQALTKTPVRTPTRTVRPTATALPTTGFGDEAGLPTLAIMGAGLLVVIIVARGMRRRLSSE